MGAHLLISGCCVAGVAAVALAPRRPARRRLRRLHPNTRGPAQQGSAQHGSAPRGSAQHGSALRGPAQHGPAQHGSALRGPAPRGPAPRGNRRATDLRRPSAWLAGVALAVLVGGWTGVIAGGVVAVALDRLLRRLPTAAERAEHLRAAGDLPLAADLLAAGLRAGAPVNRAVDAVAQAMDGPLGERLARVARSLKLGADPAEAWAHMGAVPSAARLVRAAVRSSASGGALAGAFTRLGDDLRADRTIAAEAAARRAGVLIVLPLGLCFLPAFVLAGLVPVVVAVLGDVL